MINFDAQNDFWYWINERYKIYQKKVAGEDKPWSSDPIFQQWKFCNVFRYLDTQSQYLLGILGAYPEAPDGEKLFNIFMFRAFNRYQTYKALGFWQSNNHYPSSIATSGFMVSNSWDQEKAKDTLYALTSEGGQLTSGAYMIRGREGMPKYESIVMTLDEIWKAKDNLAQELSRTHDLEWAFDTLSRQNFWGWGSFTIYQVVLDLMETSICKDAGDINTWTVFGPGAKRGLNEIWPGIKTKEFLPAAKHLLADQDKYLADYMPIMTLQDIEFCLCELGKYRRIKVGGRGKEKYEGS